MATQRFPLLLKIAKSSPDNPRSSKIIDAT